MVALQRGPAPWRKKKDLGAVRPHVEIIENPEVPPIAPNIEKAAAPTTRRAARSDRWDFGHGPVPAARHRNPDGSVGGWVAASAHVDRSVVLAPEARVYGNARVFDDARVLDRATVAGNARVYGATLHGAATVAGDATVRGADIGDRAVVAGHAHVWDGASIGGAATVGGDARVLTGAVVDGDARIDGSAWVRPATPSP